MPNIYKMTNAGGFKSLTRYHDMLAGNTTWNPWEPAGAYESIAAITVPSGGVSSISFVSIPQTYTHLQVRVSAEMTYSTSGGLGQIFMQFNGDTAQNYTRHLLSGNGTTATSSGYATGTYNYAAIERFYYNNTASGIFGASVVDILDYTNTSKNKTIRGNGGVDFNGSGEVYLYSSLWTNTASISRIDLTGIAGTLFRQYSQIALYGIKG